MAQRNSETDGMAMGLALVGVACFIICFVLYAVACFAAIIFTILALCAWNQPLTLHKWTITPHEARIFICCALAGMVALPVFMVFCAMLMQARIPQDWWGYILLGGYSLGGLGIGGAVLDAEQQQKARNFLTLPPPSQPGTPALPSPPAEPGAPGPAFRFASWDDEIPPGGENGR